MEECQMLRSREAIQLRAIAIRFLMSCSLEHWTCFMQRSPTNTSTWPHLRRAVGLELRLHQQQTTLIMCDKQQGQRIQSSKVTWSLKIVYLKTQHHNITATHDMFTTMKHKKCGTPCSRTGYATVGFNFPLHTVYSLGHFDDDLMDLMTQP